MRACTGAGALRVAVLMVLAGARLQCFSNFVSATVEITKSFLAVPACEFFLFLFVIFMCCSCGLHLTTDFPVKSCSTSGVLVSTMW